MWNLKNKTEKNKDRSSLRNTENNLVVAGEEGWRG